MVFLCNNIKVLSHESYAHLACAPAGYLQSPGPEAKEKVPSPFPWAPVTYSVPLIHDGIAFSWEYIWSRESRFHATRLEFSGTDSVDEMYAAVREICSSPQ